MCVTCGCGGEQEHLPTKEREEGHRHSHAHESDHSHSHDTPGERERKIRLEQDILGKNDHLAEHNRDRFHRDRMLVLNLVSSPGSGKTTLLERTLEALSGAFPMGVIEGDQMTSLDADRIARTGTPAVQINTGRTCHLDAHMIAHGLEKLPRLTGGVLFIENVGNLVCPSSFDLGESVRVALLSVTEGEDKPLKYPYLFEGSPVVCLTKIDLVPHTGFDRDLFTASLARVRHDARLFELSSRSGEGFSRWLDWIREGVLEASRGSRSREATFS